MLKNNKLLKKILPEVIWIIMIAIASMFLHIIFLGYEHFNSKMFDIQMPDNYVVMPNMYFKIFIFIVLYFLISLLRLLWNYLLRQKTIEQ